MEDTKQPQGELDLRILLQNLQPSLNDGSYVFCTIPDEKASIPKEAIAIFREKEGLSLILPKVY